MKFDGVVNKEGAGAGVWIMSLEVDKSKLYSYKLSFECTNNVAEYKALICWHYDSGLALRHMCCT